MARPASPSDTDFRSWAVNRRIPGTIYDLLQAPIGVGGYGLVYRVRHSLTGRECVLKALHRDLAKRVDVLERFKQEVQINSRILPHPNVVSVFDAGYTDDGRFFYVMEYLEGVTVRQALDRGPVDVAKACHVVQQVLSALTKAHALGVVHRDVKPDNVFLTGDPGQRDDVVKLLDFGIAKVLDGSVVHTAPGSAVGTYQYFAPENVQGGPITPQTDVYALGLTFWEMLTGENPFAHPNPLEIVRLIVREGVPPLERMAKLTGPISPLVCEVVRRATEALPARRFASVEQFAQALDRAMEREGWLFTRVPSLAVDDPNDPGARSTDLDPIPPWHQYGANVEATARSETATQPLDDLPLGPPAPFSELTRRARADAPTRTTPPHEVAAWELRSAPTRTAQPYVPPEQALPVPAAAPAGPPRRTLIERRPVLSGAVVGIALGAAVSALILWRDARSARVPAPLPSAASAAPAASGSGRP